MESGNAFQLYQNSGYRNDRQKKQTLVIDLGDVSSGSLPSKFEAGNINFKVNLQEPFIIDTLCDVYLDNFTTLGAFKNTGNNKTAFLVGIDQFDIQTNTNTSALFNKLVIPNEDSSTTGASGGSAHKVHKGKKMNYVSQINPQTLRQLTGSVSDMSGTTTMENSHPDNNDYRVIMEFVFVSRE